MTSSAGLSGLLVLSIHNQFPPLYEADLIHKIAGLNPSSINGPSALLLLAKDPNFYESNMNKPMQVFMASRRQLEHAKTSQKALSGFDSKRRMSVTSSMFSLDRALGSMKGTDTLNNDSESVRRMSMSYGRSLLESVNSNT